MGERQTKLLQYLYEKIQAYPDKENQVCFVYSDYEIINGETVKDDDIIEINKDILFLHENGYVQYPKMKDLHIVAAWITITEKTIEYFKTKENTKQ